MGTRANASYYRLRPLSVLKNFKINLICYIFAYDIYNISRVIGTQINGSYYGLRSLSGLK
jgi:hypothetical protein